MGQDRQGNPKADFSQRLLAKRIWIKATGDPFDVKLGSQEIEGGTLTYAAAQTFTPGTDRYLDFTVNGRLLAVRFESAGDVDWELGGYDLELEVLGAL